MMFAFESCEVISKGTMYDRVRGLTGYVKPEEADYGLFRSKEHYHIVFPSKNDYMNVQHSFLGNFKFYELPKYCEVVDKNGVTYVVVKDKGDMIECLKKGGMCNDSFTFNKLDILIVDDLFDHHEHEEPITTTILTKPTMSKLQKIMAESYMDAAKTNQVILLAKELKGRIDSLRKTKTEIDDHLENSESMLERIEEEFENPEKETMETLLSEAKAMLSNTISISN